MRKSFLKTCIPVLLIIAFAIYAPFLAGKIPLPNELILRFPPWAGGPYQSATRSYADVGDLVTLMYPFRALAAEAVHDHVIPTWNPYILTGAPFLANSQSALFYPPNALAYFLPLPFAWGLSLILRVFLAGFFMAIFVRSLGGSTVGALVSGILFASSGFMTGWQGYPIGDAAVWLPLICYAVVRMHRQRSGRSIAIAAAAFAMPVIAGHPETAVHLTLAAMLLAATLIFSREFTSRRAKFLAYFSAAGCLAVGLAAIQMLPTMEWIRQIDVNSATRWPALKLSDALGLVSRDILKFPNSVGLHIPEAASYLGMIAFAVAPLAAFHAARRYVVFLSVMTALGFMIAFGINPAYWLAMHTPILQSVKNGRLLLFVDFGLAGLAGLGISALESLRRELRPYALALVGIATGLACALIYALPRNADFKFDFLRSPSLSLALLLVGAVIIASRVYAIVPHRTFAVLVCAIAAFDGVTFSYGYLGFAPAKDIYPASPLFQFLSQHLESGPFRTASLNDTYPTNANMMYAIPSADGYDLPLRRLRTFTRGIRVEPDVGVGVTDLALSTTDRRLDLLNVKYIVANTFMPTLPMLEQLPRLAPVFRRGTVVVFENKTVLPRAFAVPSRNIEVIAEPEAQFNRLTDPAFKPEESVIVDSAPAAVVSEKSDAFQSHVELLTSGLKFSLFRTEVSAPAVLVVSQTFYPGWIAMIDGKESSVFPADMALTGISLPAGTHEVLLKFRPRSFQLGAVLSIMSLICVLALAVWGRHHLRLISVRTPAGAARETPTRQRVAQ
jgi:hypothetical protein